LYYIIISLQLEHHNFTLQILIEWIDTNRTGLYLQQPTQQVDVLLQRFYVLSNLVLVTGWVVRCGAGLMEVAELFLIHVLCRQQACHWVREAEKRGPSQAAGRCGRPGVGAAEGDLMMHDTPWCICRMQFERSTTSCCTWQKVCWLPLSVKCLNIFMFVFMFGFLGFLLEEAHIK